MLGRALSTYCLSGGENPTQTEDLWFFLMQLKGKSWKTDMLSELTLPTWQALWISPSQSSNRKEKNTGNFTYTLWKTKASSVFLSSTSCSTNCIYIIVIFVSLVAFVFNNFLIHSFIHLLKYFLMSLISSGWCLIIGMWLWRRLLLDFPSCNLQIRKEDINSIMSFTKKVYKLPLRSYYVT